MAKKTTITLFMLLGMTVSLFAQRTGYNVPGGIYRNNCEPQSVSESTIPTGLKINTIQGRSGGTGTEADPFIIANVDDFNEMASRVTAGTEAQGTVFPNGNAGYAGQYFKMNADIDGANIIQVGDYEHVFFGNFDGDNYSIENIDITFGDFGGLFSRLGAGAKVSNLSLYGNVKGAYYCGVLTSVVMTGGSVENVHNYANMSTEAYYAGGIAGAIYGPVTGCTNSGNLTSTTDFIGGIGGDVYFDVYDCVNTGDITGQTSTGGIVGYSSNQNISRCVNAGNIYGHQAYTGGVVGFVDNYSHPELDCSYLINTGEIITGSASVIGRLWVEGDVSGHADNCYYNKQNSNLQGVKPGGDVEGSVEPRFVWGMADEQLADVLGEGWTFEDNMFPRPTPVAGSDVAICAASPAFFYYLNENEYNTYETLNKDFEFNMQHDVEWTTDNGLFDASYGVASLIETGECVFTATKGGASKRYNLKVIGTDNVIENESTGFAVYPNPANDFVMIENPNVKSVKIYNLSGQCIMDMNMDKTPSQISVSDLQSGIYIIQITDINMDITNSRFTIVR